MAGEKKEQIQGIRGGTWKQKSPKAFAEPQVPSWIQVHLPWGSRRPVAPVPSFLQGYRLLLTWVSPHRTFHHRVYESLCLAIRAYPLRCDTPQRIWKGWRIPNPGPSLDGFDHCTQHRALMIICHSFTKEFFLSPEQEVNTYHSLWEKW